MWLEGGGLRVRRQARAPGGGRRGSETEERFMCAREGEDEEGAGQGEVSFLSRLYLLSWALRRRARVGGVVRVWERRGVP